MQRYRDALDHLNAAMAVIDDIGDTQAAAELSMAIATIERRIIAGKFNAKRLCP